MNTYLNIPIKQIEKAIKENIKQGILYNTCNCGYKAYKLINTYENGINKGKKPICYTCYSELLND